MRCLSDAPQHQHAGACGLSLTGVRVPAGAHQKGEFVKVIHAFTFVSRELVQQLVHRLFFKGTALDHHHLQREFPLLARVDGPHVVPPELMRLAKTYRQAVRLCLQLARHRRPGLKIADIAAACGLVRQHVTDYFHEDDRPRRRDLPAEAVRLVEGYLGNTAISQWHAAHARFTVLEVLQAQGRAA